MNSEVIDNTDEREGLPSASSIERLALCPGSFNASKGLPELLSPEMKRYSESGDRVHLYCEAPDFIDLSGWPEELEVAQQCLEQRDKVVAKVFDGDPYETTKETRMWLYGQSMPGLRDRVKLLSGKPDFGAVSLSPITMTRKALVIDYKSGRGEHKAAASNLQLRTQLVLLWTRTSCAASKGYAAIVQPLVSSEPEICEYSLSDLKAAHMEILEIIYRSKDPKAPLVPGETQCKFCPARLKCPAAADVLKEIESTDMTSLLGISAKDMAALLDKCDVAEQIIKAARSHAKAHLKGDPKCIPGWTLEQNPPTRSIEDAEAAFNALTGFGMTSEKFLKECVSVKIGALEKAVKSIAESRGEKCTAAMAKSVINTHCASLITEKQKEPSLEKVK